MLHKNNFLLILAGSFITLSACGSDNEEADGSSEENSNINSEEADTNEGNTDESEAATENEAEMGGEEMFYPQIDGDKENYPQALVETNMGDIEVILFPEQAPLAVENFLTHAEEDYYNDIIFHRVIENFMIQGGDPTGTGREGESAFGEPFEDEFDPAVAHFRGALSMANSGPDSNGSQFFVVQADNSQISEEMFAESNFPDKTVDHYLETGGTPSLDFRHTVFGHVTDGMDVVDEIASVETGEADKPDEDIVIENIEVIQDVQE